MSARPLPRRTSRTLWLAGLGAAAGWLGWSTYSALGEHYWIFKNRAHATLGASEADVKQALGPPDHQIFKADLKGRSLDYPWEGMHYRPVPERPVTNKVLLYKSAWSAAYIFIGPNGRVEQVETAGT